MIDRNDRLLRHRLSELPTSIQTSRGFTHSLFVMLLLSLLTFVTLSASAQPVSTLTGLPGQTVETTLFISDTAPPVGITAALGQVTPSTLSTASGSVTYRYTIPNTATAGTVFNDTVTVTNAQGQTSFFPIRITVAVNQAPNGSITSPASDLTVFVGSTVRFEGTGVDPDNHLPLRFAWNFGGAAANSNEQNPTVTFPRAGRFTVTLTVTDRLGLTDSSPAIRIITVVERQPPNGTITSPASDVTIPTGQSINFAGTGSDPDGNVPLRFLWTFDGAAADSTQQNPGAITFATAGVFTVTLTVTNSQGIRDPTPDTRRITVEAPPPPIPQPPNGVITSPSGDVVINAGEAVRFAAFGSDPDDNFPLSFNWDFGGGAAPSSAQNPSVVFTTPGTFTVTLTVTDSAGLVDPSPDTRRVTVRAPEAPQATITRPASSTTIRVGESINFAGRGTGTAPLQFRWNFPSGSPSSSDAESPGAVTFNTPGTFTVTFTVSNAAGSGSDARTVTVQPLPEQPTATIINPSSNVTINVGEAVNFAGRGTGSIPLQFNWNFPGGSPASSNAESPGAVTFTTPGTFTTTFTVANEVGAATASRTITVANPAPTGSTLQPQSPSTQVILVSESAILRVKAVNASGQPLANVRVNWSQSSLSTVPGTRQLSSGVVFTDRNGIAQVTLPPPAQGDIPASYQITASADVNGTRSQQSFVVTIGVEAVASPDTPERATGRAIDDLCPQLATAPPGSLTSAQQNLLARCKDLVEVSSTQQAATDDALRQLSTEETAAQLRTGRQMANQQLGNIGARLGALRAGARGVSFAGLALNTGQQQLPGSLLDSLLRGGAAGDGGEDPLGGRLGVFLNGTISIGDRDETVNEAGFDFNTYGLTGGIDYRFTDQAILGLALGFGATDLDLDQDGGTMGADSYSIAAYGNFYLTENLYLDAVLSYSRNKYDMKRNIRYAIDGITAVNETAKSNTDGQQWGGNIGLGYSFNFENGILLNLDSRLSYLDLQIDDYQEKNARGLELAVDKQDAESLTLAFGADISRAYSFNWGVLIPRLRIEWEHQFKDDAGDVRFRFASAPNNIIYRFETDTEDSDYFRLGVGASAVFSQGRSAFLYYESIRGREDYSDFSITGGIRFEF